MIDEIQDRNSRKNLYDALKDSYDLGSFEQFDKDMQSQEARKNLWDAINADYDVGTFEQFDKDMMGDKVKPEQANHSQPTNAQPNQPQPQQLQQAQFQQSLPITSKVGQTEQGNKQIAQVHNQQSSSQAMPPQATMNAPQPRQQVMSLNDRQKLWTWRNIKPTLSTGQTEQQYNARWNNEVENVKRRNDPDEIAAFNAFQKELAQQQAKVQQQGHAVVETGNQPFQSESGTEVWPISFSRKTIPHNQDYVFTLRAMQQAKGTYDLQYNIKDPEIRRDYEALTAPTDDTYRPTDAILDASPREKNKYYQWYAAYLYSNGGEMPEWLDYTAQLKLRSLNKSNLESEAKQWTNLVERTRNARKFRGSNSVSDWLNEQYNFKSGDPRIINGASYPYLVTRAGLIQTPLVQTTGRATVADNRRAYNELLQSNEQSKANPAQGDVYSTSNIINPERFWANTTKWQDLSESQKAAYKDEADYYNQMLKGQANVGYYNVGNGQNEEVEFLKHNRKQMNEQYNMLTDKERTQAVMKQAERTLNVLNGISHNLNTKLRFSIMGKGVEEDNGIRSVIRRYEKFLEVAPRYLEKRNYSAALQFWNGLTDLNGLTFGLLGVADAVSLNKIANNPPKDLIEKFGGEANAKKVIATAIQLDNMAEGYRQKLDYYGTGYSLGGLTQFGIQAGLPLFKGTEAVGKILTGGMRGLVKKATLRYMPNTAKRLGAKELVQTTLAEGTRQAMREGGIGGAAGYVAGRLGVANGVSTIVGKAAQGSVEGVVLSVPHAIANVTNNRTGQANVVEINREGIKVNGQPFTHMNQAPDGKVETDTMLREWSQWVGMRVGEVFMPFSKYVDGKVANVAKGAWNKSVGRFIDGSSFARITETFSKAANVGKAATEVGKYVSGNLKRAGMGGTLTFYAQTNLSEMLNAMTVGDVSWDDIKSDQLDKLWGAFVSNAYLVAQNNLVGTVGYYNQKINLNKSLAQYDAQGSAAWGEMDWNGIKADVDRLIDNDKNLQAYQNGVLANENLSKPQRETISQYIATRKTLQAFDLFAKVGNEKSKPNEFDIRYNDAYLAGTQVKSPDQMSQMRESLAASRDSLYKLLGITPDQLDELSSNADKSIGQIREDLSHIKSPYSGTDEMLKRAIDHYCTALAMQRGVSEYLITSEHEAVQKLDAKVDGSTNKDSGMIERAVDDMGRECYVVSGNADSSNNTDMVVVRYVGDGRIATLSPKQVNIVEKVDAENQKQENAESVRNNYEELRESIINGDTLPERGDQVVLFDGKNRGVVTIESVKYREEQKPAEDGTEEKAYIPESILVTAEDGHTIDLPVDTYRQWVRDGFKHDTDNYVHGKLPEGVLSEGDSDENKIIFESPTLTDGERISINGRDYTIESIDSKQVTLVDDNGNKIPWTRAALDKKFEKGDAKVLDDIHTESTNTNTDIKVGDTYADDNGNILTITNVDGDNVTVKDAEGNELLYTDGVLSQMVDSGLLKRTEEESTIPSVGVGSTIEISGERYKVISVDEGNNRVYLEDSNGKNSELPWVLSGINDGIKNGSVKIIKDVENGDNPSIDAAQGDKAKDAANAQQEASQSTSEMPSQTPTNLMPMRTMANGEKTEDWLSTTPKRGYDYLFNENGLSRDEAKGVLDAYLSEAQKRLDKEKEKVVKPLANVQAYKRMKAEHDTRVAEAQKEVDYWKGVKAEHEKVLLDERHAANERNNALYEKAVEEEKQRKEEELRKAAEQAERGSHAVGESIRNKWNTAKKENGESDEITLPNGETIKGHYVLTESGAASASHQATNAFQETEGFPVDENGQSVNDRDYKRDQEAQQVTRSMSAIYDQRALQHPVVVSQDGVVLSGNGRTMAGELAAQDGTDAKYIDYLYNHANKFGFTEEQLKGFKHPRVLFVTDEAMPYNADTFAKFNQREQKSQSKTELSVKMGKLVDDNLFGRVMDTIGKYDTLGDFYADENATYAVVKQMAEAGIIPQTEMASLFDGGKLSETGKSLIEGVLIGKVFQANPDAVRQITEVKSMRQAIMTALQNIVENNRLGDGYDLSKELAAAIDLVYKARKADYKLGQSVSQFARQGNLFQLDDGATVADFNNAAVMMLADVLNDGRVTQLKNVIDFYNKQANDSAQGIGDMFWGGIKTKEQIINEVNQALKDGKGNNRRTTSSTDGQSRGSQGSEQGNVVGTSGTDGKQTNDTSAVTAEANVESGATEGEKSSAKGDVVPSGNGDTPLSEKIATASAEVNTEPTEAQKEAGNYKKGHVQVGTFDITIEQPQGSVRKGTDANGKQWESKMHNTYGYFRGTEGVDGDHIDVFLSNDIDGWNGRKVYVVDQYNPDGTFDEHKVMLGFNDMDEAKSDYLANYEKGWEDGRKIVVSATNLEDFEKWIDSSHRKTKPFGEYAGVKKETVAADEMGTQKYSALPEDLRQQKADGKSAQLPTREETILRDAVIDHMKESGLDVLGTAEGQRVLDMVNGRDVRLSAKQKRALETASLGNNPRSLTVVSSADGAKGTATIADDSTNKATGIPNAYAKVQTNLENLARVYAGKATNKTRGFITDLSRALNLTQHEASNYGTFALPNGKTLAIRISNHNALVSNFDKNNENNGISIVISSHRNKRLNNDGKAHIVEYFYHRRAIENATGKPLAEILESIKDAINSGEFKDTTGLAEREEVNEYIIREQRVYHGSGADFGHFDHSHMGEGEGAQAFGWGTYVTEVEGIGRTYAESARKKPTYLYGGKEMSSDEFHDYVLGEIGDWNENMLNDFMYNLERHGVTRAKDILKKGNLAQYKNLFYQSLGDTRNYAEGKIKAARTLLSLKGIRIRKPKSHLYTIEIPDDNGKNYLDWNGHPAESLLKDVGSFLESNGFEMVQDSPAIYEKGESTIVLNPNATGADLYAELQEALGSDKEASKALSEIGLTGIKYPADYIRGGREDGAKNYVIFNENDAKITDHVRFFKTKNGEAYGFTIGGKIYIDPKVATSETPVHEYAHLWATALKANNAKEWQNVVGLMKGTSVWEEVKKLYPELKSDDEIADEVLATYSGRRGAERLRKEMDDIAKSNGNVFDKATAMNAMHRVKQAIEKFWKAVADFLHIHYTSAEQVADQVMKDLLDGVDPRSMMDGGKSLRPETRINIVAAKSEHGFKNYAEAKTWAKEHIARTYSSKETGGKGDIRISNAAVDKYLSQSAVDKSDSKDVHLSVLKVLPDVIRESVDAEQHADFKKGEDGVRSAENGINPNVTIHRLYGAVRMDGKVYRVKVTLKKNTRTKETPKAYSYEATKIELLEGSLSQTEGSHNLEPSNSKSEVSAGQHGNVSGLTSTFPRYSDKSITAANLLNGVEKSYGGGKFFEDYNKIREQFIGEQGAERADHAEEVSTRLDNLSVAREMENDKKDAKAIKMATGWERGADGKWRYEIPDLKYFSKGDAGYKKAREKQPWSKELDGLSDMIFDGEELSESEYQRFDELAQKEEKFKKDYLNREKPHLADWVENDELFKAYPDLKRVKMVFTDQLPVNVGGSYNEREHTIAVNTNYVGDIASVLAHEVQHAIQKIEGFARGGNPESMQERFDAAKKEWRARAWADELRYKADEMGEHYNQAAVEKALIDEYKEMGMDNDEWMPNKETRMKGFNYFARGYADRSLDADIKNFRLNESTRSEFSPYVEYTKLGGEVESRNVEHRMNMTPEERIASLAAETEDVSREDQIFLMSGDGGNANSEMPQERETDDDYSEFAKEHGVDADMVKDYASGMKTGNLQRTDMALAEIRRTMRVANRGMKLSEFGKLFRPVQKELAERYGDIETLRQEHIDAVMRERGVMEAARKRAEEEEAKRKARADELSLLSTEELDKRYFDAIESGDDAAAREMLDEAARRKGYDDTESNYQGVGAWIAPSNPGYESDAARREDVEENAPDLNIEDIALGYSLVDEKYWQEPRKYMQTDATAVESVNAIREAIAAVRRGEKNVKVKVYRAVPTSVKEGKLRNGDWVTPSKDYAKMHGEHRLGGDYRIIEDEVPVNELWWDGNDSREWGFDDGRDYKYKNVENNRKLNDLVTHDDNGEIIPPSKRFDENVEDVRYRTSEELDQINQKFNERLDELVSNPNQKDKVLHLGRSSEFLKDGGISDAEIVLEYDKLVRKSKEGYKHEHPFDISDVRDLPKAIASPIAVFDNTNGKNDGKVILTELKKDGRNFIVAIQTANLNRKGGKVLEVNKIVTLFPKDARGVINWFNIGKATNIDKKKALHFIEALLNHPETTITNEELSTAAKVVKDFENSQIIPVEKSMSQAATDLAQQLHVDGEVEILTTTEGLTGRQAKAKGWYDVRTGKVTIVLPNNKNAADVRETVFHEVVAHKGLRNLVGEEHFNTFLDNVYNNAEEGIKQTIDEMAEKKYKGDKRKATEEYMAHLAEDGEFAKPENQSFFAKVRDFLTDLLKKVGIKLGFNLTDNDLRYILWRSWKNLTEGPARNIYQVAEDAAMQEHLQQTPEAKQRHEEEVYFREVNDSIKDIVDKTKSDLAKLNEDKRNHKAEAVKAIGGRLSELNKAMREQRAYDLHTVASITDMAKTMLKNRLLTNLSSTEVSRLLSVVNNVHGKKDIKNYVQKVLDMMVDNQVSNLNHALTNLLLFKGKKVNAQGVEVQGKLDLDGQRMAEVVWNGIGLTDEVLSERMADAQDRMDSDSQVISKNASIDYAAYQLVQQYNQGIRDSKIEEQSLRNSLKQAKEDLDAGLMDHKDYLDFVDSVNQSIRDNKMERVDSYRALIDRLGGVYAESIEKAKAFRKAEADRVNEIHHYANSDMEGRPAKEHHKPTGIDNAANNGILRLLTAPLGTFDQMLRMFGNKNVKGEGYLWNHFMRGWTDARNNEVEGYRGAIKELDDKVEELFGKGVKFSDLFSIERKLENGVVSFYDGGDKTQHEIPQGNLLYIYMVNKMPDGKMKLRKMGISEGDVEKIADFIDPRLKQFADWVQSDFLVKKRDKYNAVHERLFGASMADIENYFPLKILKDAITKNVEIEDMGREVNRASAITGGIKKRVRNSLPLDIMEADAFSVLMNHIKEMEHWAAFAEWNKDLNTLLSYKRFRIKVKNMASVYGSGQKLLNHFEKVCQIAAGVYKPETSVNDKFAMNIAKGVTGAKVSGRMFTAFKQLTSFPAYLSDANPIYLAEGLSRPYKAWKWSMENLPILRERWQGRFAGDPLLMSNENDWKLWRTRTAELAAKYGMAPNAFVDALTISMGTYAIYKTKLAKYLRMGYDESTAEERAKQDATIAYNQTQQSSEGAFMSVLQSDRTYKTAMLTAFRNSSMSYTRQLYDALRNYKRLFTPGYKGMTEEFMAKQMERDGLDPQNASKYAKREYRKAWISNFVKVGVFGFLLQYVWNLVGYAPYLAFGDDKDKKKKMWSDILTHSLFGSVEGLSLGDVWSALGNTLFRENKYDDKFNANNFRKELPIATDLNNMLKDYESGGALVALNDVINLVVQSGIGFNPQTLTDALVAVYDYCGADDKTARECALMIMRVMNCPPSQMKQIYFDEIDATGEQASKMTPAQIAERYARYKLRKDAPFTSSMYSDDTKNDKLSKYKKQVTDEAKTRFEEKTQTEETKRLYEEYDKTAKKVSKIHQLQDTDTEAYQKQMREMVGTAEFKRYRRIGLFKSLTNKLAKQMMRSKSASERKKLHEQLIEQREKMLNDVKGIE